MALHNDIVKSWEKIDSLLKKQIRFIEVFCKNFADSNTHSIYKILSRQFQGINADIIAA